MLLLNFNFHLAKGQGYEKLEDLEFKLFTTAKADVPTDFNGNGLIHVELLEQPKEKLLEIAFPYSIMLSEIVLEMPNDKSFTEANISVVEQEIQYSKIWKRVWVSQLVLFFENKLLSLNCATEPNSLLWRCATR